MKIKFYPEICCEICNEVIHNHMNCPVCEGIDVGTSIYIDLDYVDIGRTMSCEECGAEFKLISKDSNINNYEWQKI